MSDNGELVWRLRNESQVPPGGWRYRCAATGWELPNGTSGSLDSKVKHVIDHHAANPAKNLELDPLKVRMEIYTQTVANVKSLRGGEGSLEKVPKTSAPVGSRPLGLPSSTRPVAAAVGGDLLGAKIIAEWFGDGGQPVPKAQAESRASVCLACPKNNPKERPVIGFIAGGVKWVSEFKSQKSLHLPNEDKLGTCDVCSCPLPTKLWVPIKHLMRDKEHEFPENCWLPKEAGFFKGGRYDMSAFGYTQNLPEPPAVTAQSGWKAGLFDIKSKVGELYFNPGVIRLNGTLYLASRYMPFPYTRATIVFFRLGEDLKPKQATEIKYFRTYAHEHMEDGRCIAIPGDPDRFLLATTSFYITSKQHQNVFVVRASDFKVENQIHIEFGGNGSSIDRQIESEKNWQFFHHEGRLHFVYWIAPKHIVCEVADGKVIRKHETDTRMTWPFGRMCGGTPPVLVGDLYWSFFHSSQQRDQSQKRYFMGAYAFDAKPPFKVRHISKAPIMAGTEAHPITLWKHLVVFPTGALLDPQKQEWLVTLGVNDCLNAWVKIPHKELLETVA